MRIFGGSIVGAAGLVALVVCISVAAGQESRRGDRVLHRYLDETRWRADGGGVAAGAGLAQPGASGQGLSVAPGSEEWIWTAQGPVGPQAIGEPHGPLSAGGGETALDDVTDRVESIHYQASFEPSVVPFKRGVVQNRVRQRPDGSYAAYLEPGRYEEVSLEGQLFGDEERFRGSFLVRLTPGERQGLPSVAPAQRIVSYSVEPDVELKIERDEGANYFISADYDGLMRVQLELAVSSGYFDGDPHDFSDWSGFEEPGYGLDQQSQAAAERIFVQLGISRQGLTPRQALMRLVEYYRDFEARPFPGMEQGGDLFVELTTQQVGVCRHRSLAFMIAAQALGIRTNYVYNEAHAFVEVYWPGQGWRRIDLGGAADSFDYQNQGSGRIHQGGREDIFPRPPAFQEELALLEGEEQKKEEAQAQSVSDAVLEEASEVLEDEPQEVQQERLEMVEEQSAAPQVELLEADGEVLRGQQLRVRGRISGKSSGSVVELYLVPVGGGGGAPGVKLGEAVVDERGFFEGSWEVPGQVGLGRWKIEGRKTKD